MLPKTLSVHTLCYAKAQIRKKTAVGVELTTVEAMINQLRSLVQVRIGA